MRGLCYTLLLSLGAAFQLTANTIFVLCENESAAVNLATHRATLAVAPGFDVAAVVTAVDAAGYAARPRVGQDPLEPEAVTAAAGGRVAAAWRRVALSAALSAPLMALSMVHALHFAGSAYVQAALGVGVVLGAGGPGDFSNRAFVEYKKHRGKYDDEYGYSHSRRDIFL
jgi:hypothetical protein